MTEPPSTPHSNGAQTLQATVDGASGAVNAISASKNSPAPEEPMEDYQIKCICGYTEADQQTVYCEKCDTWQHIECYYTDENGFIPTKDEMESLEHLCIDCSPRPLDVKSATLRQRARREDVEPNEKKAKKPTAKSHKKKAKTSEANGVLVNGWAHGGDSDGHHDRTSRSPHNTAPPSKRPKANHRASNSTTLLSAAQNASAHSHKRTASTMQPTSKFPSRQPFGGNEKELFSTDFLRLYDNDPGDTPLHTNSFNDIHITSDLSLWTNDIEALRKATPFSHPDIFQRTEQPISSMQMPEIHKEEKVAEDITLDGRHPRWKYLTIDSDLPKGALVGEIMGKIGHMTEYIQNPSNQWEYLRHPAPFVFFHPRLPIYIDTRMEGTTCRYLRRSCAPNLAMKTFLEDGQYHFCFIAQCDLEAGSELTIGWVPDENMRRFFDPNHNGMKQEIGADQEEYIADWASKVLPEFGGCACSSSGCTWSRFSKRSHAPPKARNGASRGQTINQGGVHSREGSYPDNQRSSSSSKSASRDVSPTDNNANDAFAPPGLEISAREKRKIAALEKNFEQLENDKHQPATKKKKRNSGGTHVGTPNAGASKQFGQLGSLSQPNTPGLASKSQYIDSGTSRRRSGSPPSKSLTNSVGRPKAVTAPRGKQRFSLPNTPAGQRSQPRPNYVSRAAQTDPTESEEERIKSPRPLSHPPKPFVSLTKRLLLRAQHERQLLEQKRRASAEAQASQPADPKHQPTGIGVSTGQDVEMQDAPTTSPMTGQSPTLLLADPSHQEQDQSGESAKFPSKPWPPPSLSAKIDHQGDTNGLELTDVPGQPPPKPPEASNGSRSEMPNSHPQSPLISNNPAPPALVPPAQTPAPAAASNHVQPSPVPKKMSLSEYLRRKGSSSAHEKPASATVDAQPAPFKSPTGVNGEGKGLVNGHLLGQEESAIVDSPRKEISDPMDVDRDKTIAKEEQAAVRPETKVEAPS